MTLLDRIITDAASLNASDIHLLEGRVPYFRIDGKLININSSVSNEWFKEILGDFHLNPEQYEKLNLSGDIDLSYRTPAGQNTRVNISYGNSGMNIALRIISRNIPTPDELHIPFSVRQFIQKEHGLILICGPTGSGKSTTIASLINGVNQDTAARIITIEDPVEYYFPVGKSVVTQREIGRNCISFSQGLKAALRQDPDIIMVGELRDAETISTALAAAETGHLVFSTLHTGNVGEAIDRLVQYFPAEQQLQIRNQVATALVGVVTQKLLPCTKGGRIAAFEILINTPSIANLIRKNEIFQFQNYMYPDTGMQTMQEAEALLVKKHLIH